MNDDYFKTDVGYVCKLCNAELGMEYNIQNHVKTAHSKK